MKKIVVLLILFALFLLAACGGGAAPTEAPAATEAPAMEAPAMEALLPAASADQAGAQSPQSNTIYETGVEEAPAQSPLRMIIKNADVRLLVKDTEVAIDGVTQIVGDTRGYIVSSRVWYQDYYGQNYKYATLTIGVPVDQFENVLRRLRNLSIRVIDEQASGDDVTDQYVDLESQLRNLEATRDRVKSFLDQAKTVDEALQINQQLSEIEAQIEQIKGQMNYLGDRSSFSTVTVNIEPDLPPIVFTPTPTPTPQPIEALGPWHPERTFKEANKTLTSAYRGIIEFLIWLFVVVIPIFGPPVLIVWLIRRWYINRQKKP